jgi:cyclophilin family peptidyl-prolyl cis-trans isomerase
MVGLLTVAGVLAFCTGVSPVPPDPYTQIIGLEASRSLGAGRLAEYANGKDERLAVRALLALGRTRDVQAAPILLGHMHDRSLARRAMAVYGLGLVGRPEDAGVPAAVLSMPSQSPVMQVVALDSIDRYASAKKGGPAFNVVAESLAQRLMRTAPSPVVRGRAAQALNAFANTNVTFAAERALSSAFLTERSAYVRWHIMWSVFRGYAVQVPRSVIARGLRDGDETVRIESVRALGRMKDRKVLALLQPMTHDPSWRVQEQALESIKVVSGGALTDHLKAIPAGVRVPAHRADPLDALPALPRAQVTLKPSRPSAEDVGDAPALVPDTLATIVGPQPGHHPRVRLVTTKGNLYVELYPEWAPITATNFLRLSERGYYDNNPWFRIVPDFVVQTGDPSGNGEGDAGFTIPAEENPLEQDSYVISMGLNYDDKGPIRDSAGTQFYITLSPQLHLDRDFTVFGRVVGGFDVLGRLVESDKIVRAERIADR